MKKFLYASLFVLGLALPQQTRATHVAGGEITYVHLGNNNYRITLTLYRDAFGATLGNVQPLCITSSCAAQQIINLNATSHPNFTQVNPNGDTVGVPFGAFIPEQRLCAEPANPNGQAGTYELYTYDAVVNLPPCFDWKFGFTLNARNNAITNGPSNASMHINALLNNTNGPNDSPQFLKPGIRRFCVLDPTNPNSRPFKWDHPANESDNDSIYYRFSQPQSGPQCGINPVYIPWAAGFSTTAPMVTATGISVDHRFGFFTFLPTQQDVCVVVIDVEEYRFNSSNSYRWELVGKVTRDMQIPIDAGCITSVLNGPKIDVTKAGYGTRVVSGDSIQRYLRQYLGGQDTAMVFDVSNPSTGGNFQIPTVPYNCGNNSITLDFEIPIFCPTIDPTDFRLAGPDGKSRPIDFVETDCTPTFRETSSLKLNLYQPLDVNGEYLLYIRNGNDGNTLENKCGYAMDDNFYMIIKVTDCPELDYEIRNVTVVEDEVIDVEFYLDPTSYFSTTFNQISVLRANSDQNFYKVGEIKDQTLRSFTDTLVDKYAVDNQVYQYILQLHTSGNPRTPSNFVNSILLQADSAGGNNMKFSWSAYLNDTYGGVAQYEFFEGVYDSAQGDWVWTSLAAVGNSLEYTYSIPQNRPGQWWYKVEATDGGSVNTTTSVSNYLNLGVPEPPVVSNAEPLVNYIPNVITPNGDSHNDRFYFQFIPTEGARPYSNLSLSIFNRWGRKVFIDDNFMARNSINEGWEGVDQFSGKPVADGVYFYVARFTDTATGQAKEINGSITVTGGY
jgi:gliding motility-associated-like protein